MTTYFYSIIRFASRVGLFTGPCLLIVAFFVLIHTFFFLHQSVSSTGRVVSLNSRPAEDASVNYFPVFTFTASNGQIYTISSNSGSNPSEFTVGQAVTVKYRTADPSHAKIESYWQLWTLATAFSVLGFVFGGFGLAFLIYERRRDRGGVSIIA